MGRVRHGCVAVAGFSSRLESPGIRVIDLIPTNWKARFYKETVPAQYRTTPQEAPQSED
jgi:hypothetical protein